MENTPTHRSSKTAAILMAAAIAMPIVVSSSASAHENSLVQAEIARRELQMVEADKLILDGRKAYQSKNYEEAVANYRKAVSMLPPGPIAAERRRSYTGHLLDGSIALSTQYRRTGKYTEARELLDNVLETDPGNVIAKKNLEYLDDPIRTSPTLTYEHTQNIEKVRKTLYRAQSYFDQAQFDEAYLEYQEVLRVDPYNQAARRGMQNVDRAKMDYYRAAYDQTRAAMLREVDAAWETAIPIKIRDGFQRDSNSDSNDNPALLLRDKLQRIIVPLVDFDEETTVQDAIQSLRQRARELDTLELDPEKKGLNFVIRNTAVFDVSSEIGDDAGGGAEESSKIENIVVGALNLRNVPLEEALKQVCQTANLRFKVEDFSVVILRATDVEDDELYTRTFRVPPDLLNLLGGSGGGGGGGASDDPFAPDAGAGGEQKTVKELLELTGVKFTEEATAGFSKARATLTVRNTANALDQVEELVDELIRRKPTQVKMLTKFVEISQENSDELGFDWVLSPFGITSNNNFLSGGTIGNGSNRTAGDFVSSVNGTTVDGLSTFAGASVNNIVTAGNRSGDFGISTDSIDAFLNNPNRTADVGSVAPGILSLTGLFTDGQVQLILRGLSQKSGADVMTAPSIVSRSGERATIEIIREFIYPTEFEPPELPNNIDTGGNFNDDGGGGGASTFPVTPSTPTAFETRNTGVILEVEPILGEDGYTIDLTFRPEIVEFEGFINYGSPIQTSATDALGNPITITITENRIEMPVFATRRVNTSLTIYDGHTVAVGGLIQENVQTLEDKVPILGDLPIVGRLFQTTAEARTKSNLIIFVTARIIDATGQPIDQAVFTGATGDAPVGVGELLPPIGN